MTAESNQHDASPVTVGILWLFALIVAALGMAMTVSGVRLIELGGSFYYAPAGAAIVVSAVLLLMRRRQGAWLYAALLAVTIIWSIWEAGFDPWSLLPRLALLLLLGAWLLLPWSQSPLRGHLKLAKARRFGATKLLAGGAVASVLLGALLHATVGPVVQPDPRFQTGFGAFPAQATYQYNGENGEDWPFFGGNRGGARYTPLGQITPANVSRLKPAWSVDMGTSPYFNATPIKVDDSIYSCNIRNEVFALDARTGKQRWTFDASYGSGGSCRGVALYKVPGANQTLCASRVITGTNSARLVALDANTGALCPDFGDHGVVDLLVGMADADGNVIPGYYRVTSAPTLVRGKVVVGGMITDGQFWGEPSGVIRAFDAVTGKLSWAWDVGRPENTGLPPDGQSYTPNTPNAWAPMSADEEEGMVFLPTGSPTPDYFGAQRRPFDEKFANSVIALDAETGRLAWSFQAVHHDLWDYDVASQPTLLDLRDRSGVMHKALIQPTKRGDIFVLDRLTGKLIFGVTEKPVPQAGAAPEERLSPTQPFSDQLPSFRGATLRESDMWGMTPLDQLYCRINFKRQRYEGIFTPPGPTPMIAFPSGFGAINWGSTSIDPLHAVMVVNSSRVAGSMKLITRAEAQALNIHRAGPNANPREAIGRAAQENTPYAALPMGIQNVLGLVCTAPPYGLLSAVDLNTGKLLWTQRFGTSLGSGPLRTHFPLAWPMGTPTHGGSLVTASGIIFIGASKDNFLSAFDLRTGQLLWRYELPGGGGTPISYTVDGRQYIAVSAGGQPAIQSRASTKMMAFALPAD